MTTLGTAERPELDGMPDAALRRLSLTSPSLLCATDHGVLFAANPAWSRTLGWRTSELLGRPLVDLVHPDDTVRVVELVGAQPSGSALDPAFEVRLRASTGSYRLLSWSGAAEGSCWYGVGTDVTDERAATDRALMLAEIVAGSDDAIFSQGLDRQITSWNAAAERLYGYTAAELLGRSAGLLVPETHRTEVELLVANVLRGEPVQHYETQRTRKGGALLQVSLSLSPVFDRGGRIVGASSVARDVTGRNAAIAAGHRSEQQFRRIIEATNEGVWEIDLEEQTTFVNPQMAGMLGYTPEEMQGQSLWNYISPDRHVDARASLERRRSHGLAERIEFCFTRRDGSDCYALLSTSALLDPDGGYCGAIAVVTDLTHGGANSAVDARRLLLTAAATMREAVLRVDVTGLITFGNVRAAAIFERSDVELPGLSLLDLLDAADGSAETATIAGSWSSGQAVHLENAKLRSGGRTLAVSLDAWPQFDHQRADGAMIIIRDISARRAEEDQRAEELEQLAWVGRTKDALDEGRLFLHAQPIVELATGAVISHELLLRMRDTAGRLVVAATFLPPVERHGLIGEIDSWVVSQAMRIAAAGHPVEVNLSAQSVADPGMLRRIDAAIRDSGADPRLVTFEVTETAIMQHMETAASFVNGLRGRGFGLSLDDFGTGYGSFTYLKRLPATKLKIDRQFIKGLVDDRADQHVVQAIVDLARRFGQQVVAEGVEDQQTLELLKQYGVDYVQGFLFGRPRPVEEIWPTGR